MVMVKKSFTPALPTKAGAQPAFSSPIDATDRAVMGLVDSSLSVESRWILSSALRPAASHREQHDADRADS
jgi:hypothetical protein